MRANEFIASVRPDRSSKTLAKLSSDAEDIRREQDGQHATSPASLATPVERIISLYKSGTPADIATADQILSAIAAPDRYRSDVLAAKRIAALRRGYLTTSKGAHK